MEKNKKENKKSDKEAVFTKEQFLNSTLYRQHRDVLNAVLDDGKKYTKKQVNTMIDKFIGKRGK